jgi:hypothetical protein
VILAIVVGFLIGGSGGGSGPAKPPTGGLTTTAASSSAEVKVPSGWSKLATAPDVAGLGIADATAAAPGGKDGGDAVVVGTVKKAADNSTLLAGTFLQGFTQNQLPKPSAAVQIGSSGLQAYRYDDLKPNGFDRSVTVYAAPTTAGVATVACLTKNPGSLSAVCDQIANTLKVSAGKPLPVGPSKDYASAVTKTFGTLNAADKAGVAKLNSAKTPQAQAAAARSLSAAYAKAASTLAKQNVNPADAGINGLIVGALRQTSAAYAKAAKAAAAKNKSGFSSAKGAVASGRKAVADALVRLKAAGYDVAS